MQYLTTVLALLSTSLFATAAPTSERRACSVAYPQKGPAVYAYQEAGGINKEVSVVVTFDKIPAGSRGCQLELNFAPDYLLYLTGDSRINIYAASPGASDTLFGNVKLAIDPENATKYVVNSTNCDSQMSYWVEIASKDQAGHVVFVNTEYGGFMMAYNC